MPLMVPVVALTYVATQRRAAFLTLVIALSLLAIILYKENRLAFWLIMPPLALMGILYIGAFWNNTGAIGMPAQAVKGFIAPDQASEANRGSDIYRILENFNSGYTIHARPLTGVGFGQKFYMAVQLPDISFFEFWEYITHNSIMWIG
ncbi:MAG: O-antigen ligase family protein [Chloroflexi bacterium]|nr:O-antigen ligase family protein [Chloroflexota bacterium]